MKQTKLWALVMVKRGFPFSLTFLKNQKEAYAEQTRLNSIINPDYDETEIFEVCLKDLIQKNRVEVNV